MTFFVTLMFPIFVQGQNEFNENPPSPSNDASHPCISAADYQIIEQRCRDNMKTLHIDAGAFKKTRSTSLSWPLKAANGLTDCSYYHIAAYVDQNVTVGQVQDYNCGTNTYDGHTGTDISTWPFNFYKMDNDQVEVIAAAAGIILDKHDGEFDRNCSANNLPANYVIIQHADGSQILYWHMKKNSITTKPIGQSVIAGEKLGVAGSSGSSSGPHLHFEVWSGATQATRIDPYTGACNTLNATSWWASQKNYKETTIMKATTHTTDVVMPGCPTTETLNESNSFTIPFQGAGLPPGYAKFYIFIRDEVNGLVADLSILKPDNTPYLTWNYTSPSDNKTKYWGWSKILPTVAGTYTFKAVYNGNTCTSTFDIINNPAGIEPVAANNKVKIYPLPNDGNFIIDKNNLQADEIDIFSIYGSRIYHTELQNELTPVDLNIAKGIYFYCIKNNLQTVATGKILIQ